MSASGRFIDIQQRLVAHLRAAIDTDAPAGKRAVIMNDFSLDHMVRVPDYAAFRTRADEVVAQKGGILLAGRQSVQQGGCAANTATTLARLGVETHFLCRTSPLGRVLADYYLGRAGVKLEHVKEDGTLAIMTALEVGAETTNIMINDLESFSPFGFDDLDESDLALISSAAVVGVFDWCLNRRGTHLAKGLLDWVATTPECVNLITYLDTSDPAPRRSEMAELRTHVLAHPRLDWLAVNENELRHYADDLQAQDTPEGLAPLVRRLSAELPATLCAHTARFAIEFTKSPVSGHSDGRLELVPGMALTPRRGTGAGDSWNGGNILGLLLNLPADERLMLANAVAGYYISAEDAERPTLSELVEFLTEHEGNQQSLAPLPEPFSTPLTAPSLH